MRLRDIQEILTRCTPVIEAALGRTESAGGGVRLRHRERLVGSLQNIAEVPGFSGDARNALEIIAHNSAPADSIIVAGNQWDILRSLLQTT